MGPFQAFNYTVLLLTDKDYLPPPNPFYSDGERRKRTSSVCSNDSVNAGGIILTPRRISWRQRIFLRVASPLKKSPSAMQLQGLCAFGGSHLYSGSQRSYSEPISLCGDEGSGRKEHSAISTIMLLPNREGAFKLTWRSLSQASLTLQRAIAISK